MSEFKTGDRVRPTQEIAQEIADFHEAQGTTPSDDDRYVIERVEFVVTRVSHGDGKPFPIGITPVEGKISDIFVQDGGLPSNPEELEKI